MPSLSTRLFNATARILIKPVFTEFNIQNVRRLLGRVDRRLPNPRGVSIEADDLEHCRAEWIIPDEPSSDRVILYFSGGAWVLRSPRTHRCILARLVKKTNARGRLAFYRLAPEFAFPQPLDDCIEAYRQLLAIGIAASRIVIGGDSAGGHLCLSTLVALRDKQIPLPAAAFALSPATDMHLDPRGSRVENADLDPVFPLSSDYSDQDPQRLYVGGNEKLFDHPHVSR